MDLKETVMLLTARVLFRHTSCLMANCQSIPFGPPAAAITVSISMTELSPEAGVLCPSTGGMLELPTYIRDTTQALHLVQHFRFPGPQHLIFTMDVLCFFLSRRPDQFLSTDTLIRLVELVLTLNNFFNSSHFLQTKGVAMGTRMGPS
eukprot:g43769.t1